MVEPTLIGRLGNFMFEVATAYAYSLRHGMEYNVNQNEDCNNYINRFFPKIETKKVLINFDKWKEPTHAYTEIPKFENVKILEYFQSEKYFKDYRKEVMELFDIPYSLKKGYTSIHVRRGDYLIYFNSFPPVDERYLSNAMRLMARNGFKKFLVFSDDIKWCKDNLNPAKYPEYEFEYSEGKNEYEDLMIGSWCEHNIISNSTFSWWQAWLNQNPNKIVVSPSKFNWFGKRVKLSTEDIIPESWEQINF